MDAPLPLGQKMAVRIHLVMCRCCLRFYRQLMLLRKLSRLVDSDLQPGATPERLSENARQRIKEKIRTLA